MLTVVCWKWEPLNPLYRSKFDARNVHTLYSMVNRHYARDFRFVCVTDDPSGIDPSIETIPLWDTHRFVPSPLGDAYPACYARLAAFAPDFADSVGERFVSVDLDCVITDDITPLWDRDEDFIIWQNDTKPLGRPDAPVTPYNGSMWLMTTGSRRQVFDEFDPVRSPIATHNAGYVGSDQAWIAHCLGPDEATWTRDDGVMSWRKHLKNRNYRQPSAARIIFFQGQEDPWDQSALDKAPWIEEHYR